MSEVRPLIWLFCETMFVGTLCAPDYTSRGTSGIETGMGFVSFVGITELTMDLGVDLCWRGPC